MLTMERMVEVAVDAAAAAGREILQIYRRGSPKVMNKADDTPVTVADTSSQAIITSFLQRTGLPVISEEDEVMDFETRKSWEYCWLIDPLDGTREFIAGTDEFTINIGLVRGGRQGGNLRRLRPAVSRPRFGQLGERSPLRGSRFALSPVRGNGGICKSIFKC